MKFVIALIVFASGAWANPPQQQKYPVTILVTPATPIVEMTDAVVDDNPTSAPWFKAEYSLTNTSANEAASISYIEFIIEYGRKQLAALSLNPPLVLQPGETKVLPMTLSRLLPRYDNTHSYRVGMLAHGWLGDVEPSPLEWMGTLEFDAK